LTLRKLRVYTVHVPTRQNSIVNRLNKTKIEKEVDHEEERVERLKKEGAVKRAVANERVRFPGATPPFSSEQV
jgi:hypothetical protein